MVIRKPRLTQSYNYVDHQTNEAISENVFIAHLQGSTRQSRYVKSLGFTFQAQ